MKNTIIKLITILFLTIPLTARATSYSQNTTVQDKYILKEIIAKIRDGRNFSAIITSNNSHGKNWFASYGFSTKISKASSNSIKIKNIKTSFSDRAHFTGNKTTEEITIYEVRGKLDVRIVYKNWNNDRIKLENIQVKKANNTYFISGNYTYKGKTSFINISIKDFGKLH